MGLILPLLMVYAIAVALPLSAFGYDPMKISVEDSYEGEVPKMGYDRKINSRVLVSYSTVIRNADGLTPVCLNLDSGVAEVEPGQKTLPEALDVGLWTNGHCKYFPEGSYTLESCFTGHSLLLGFLPEKTECLEDDFTVLPRKIIEE